MKPIRVLLLYAQDSSWATLSYATSLPGAIARSAHFDVTAINLAGFGMRDGLLLRLRCAVSRFDAVFVLHSVFSNGCYMPDRLADQIARLRRPVVFFVGNEYKSMPEKMALAERLRTGVLVSQISEPDVLALYARRLNCIAIFLPNAVADPLAFPPGPKIADRPIAIGYRAFDGVMYLGHNDRRRIAEIMEPAAAARGLACDISLDPSRRLGGADWTAFLHACRAQLGVEAGTDYFELDDRSRVKGNALEVTQPGISFDKYFEIVFGGYSGRVSGRTITSRHLECATTHTPMIMFPGKYCGVFEANRHYLALDRDGGNREDILDQLADDGRCAEIAAAANDAAIEHFSETRLMARLRRAIADVAA